MAKPPRPSKATHTILQIMPPTPGWALKYFEEDKAAGDVRCFYDWPVAFALIESKFEGGIVVRAVDGIDSCGDPACSTQNYCGLTYVGTKLPAPHFGDDLPSNHWEAP